MAEDRGGNPEVMALLGKTHLTWKRFLQKALVGEDITLKQYYVLLQLRANEVLFPAQVAEMLFCDRPTASVVLRNMERHGWISRRKDPGNRKQVRLGLTPAGRAELEYIEHLPELTRRFRSDPLACFSAPEAEMLEGMLRRLLAHLTESYQF